MISSPNQEVPKRDKNAMESKKTNSSIIHPSSSSKTSSQIVRNPDKQIKSSLAGAAENHSRVKGLSLGLKYAIITSVIVAVAMTIMLLVAFNSARQVVDDEINQAGIRLVQTLATIDISYWKSVSDRTKDNPDPLTFLRSLKGERMGVNVPTILNIVIRDKNKKPLAGIDLGDISLVGSKPMPPLTKENINMLEGMYREGDSKRLIRTRMFQKRIVSSDLAGQGDIILFLSATKIDEVLNGLFSSLLYPAFLAILCGGILGFFMARWVTKPVKILMEDMAAVSAGNLDYKSRVNSSDEVGVLAKTFDKMTDDLKNAHQRDLESKALEHELNIAREIQDNLLPKEIPSITGYSVAARYSPCFEVGGDYYDILQLDNDHVGIVVADVSGKGIPASMIMTMARSLIRMESERNLSTADTLKKVNRILARDLRRGMFVTALYYILNIRTGILTVSSAGHNPLIVWRKDRNSYELINPNGIALGFDRGPVFDRTVQEESIQINQGDVIIGFTDGVVETMNQNNQEFGSERFYKLLGTLYKLEPPQIIDSVISTLSEYKGRIPQHDDITIVCLKRAENRQTI